MKKLSESTKESVFMIMILLIVISILFGTMRLFPYSPTTAKQAYIEARNIERCAIDNNDYAHYRECIRRQHEK